jgi:nicotinate-nucleotide pyrophosphorylase (carboxylating)
VKPLEPEVYRDIVRRALAEDLEMGTGVFSFVENTPVPISGDITTAAIVRRDQRARGVFVVKTECVLAGLDVAAEAFTQVDSGVSFRKRRLDGERCTPGDEVAYVQGPASALLVAERTALNFLQRMSGIATEARRFVDAAAGRITVLDTRKTTPTLRALEKYAVAAGGATNHRFGLFDAVLIKDNHVRLAGGVRAAVAKVRERQPEMRIEVEAQSLAEVDEALEARADVILADNLPLDDVRETVRRAEGRAKVEISGGVTLERLRDLAATGADYVSVGALTHSAPAVDISFEITPL